jgi:hypothetical protein
MELIYYLCVQKDKIGSKKKKVVEGE